MNPWNIKKIFIKKNKRPFIKWTLIIIFNDNNFFIRNYDSYTRAKVNWNYFAKRVDWRLKEEWEFAKSSESHFNIEELKRSGLEYQDLIK